MAHFNKQAAQSACLQAIAASFNKPSALSDITITCGNQRILCHRFILTQQSKWFEKAFEGHFKESKSDIIELHDEDEDVIHAMLKFCYQMDYEAAGCDVALSLEQHVNFHALVFAAGEKHFVQGLAHLAADKFIAAAKTASEESLAEAINTVYTAVSDPDKILRKAVVDIVLEKASTLLSNDNTTFDKLFETLPSFGGDIARRLARKSTDAHPPQSANAGDSYQCPGFMCERIFSASLRPGTDYTYWCPSCPGGFGAGHWRFNFSQWQTYKVSN